ncbi:hypothetical protein NAC44_05935 [Allorhizobium sp. BGMRC 0089]|uniref:hypothetical protein n=1 Tax=Allorhizobium sonneratiae TaxID=2934936 RepID=UPI002033C88D|nr:hypothetical protein [Allorhizobium sonneratiae]MCM2291866.1 hypothetical protein [Allorhizobium sonneratiae]
MYISDSASGRISLSRPVVAGDAVGNTRDREGSGGFRRQGEDRRPPPQDEQALQADDISAADDISYDALAGNAPSLSAAIWEMEAGQIERQDVAENASESPPATVSPQGDAASGDSASDEVMASLLALFEPGDAAV